MSTPSFRVDGRLWAKSDSTSKTKAMTQTCAYLNYPGALAFLEFFITIPHLRTPSGTQGTVPNWTEASSFTNYAPSCMTPATLQTLLHER